MPTLETMTQVANELAAGRLEPIELVERCCAQIDALEPTLRAWVVVDREGARREAERLGELLRRGVWLGPLHGVPVGIKDLIDVAGFPTRSGSPLSSPEPVDADAPVVARLRAAGAIILGKTVTTEWACFDPPPTRNPWNAEHTPGGSSSGSAVAVATGMCFAALGSQTGGSIIRPAAYCGVAGLKPTHGRVSAERVTPVSYSLDHVGPLARSASDLWHMFRAIADDHASLSPRLPTCEGPLRVGVVRGLFDEEASDEVRRVFAETLAALAAGGVELFEAELPTSFAGAHASHWLIMAVDAATVHRDAYWNFPEQFGPKVASLLDDGRRALAVDYTAALAHQRQFRHDVAGQLGDSTIWIMPATNTTAPRQLDTTGSPRFNSPWSFAGVPELTIPCGFDAGGMPCGLQLVGPPGREDLVVAMARELERRLPVPRYPLL